MLFELKNLGIRFTRSIFCFVVIALGITSIITTVPPFAYSLSAGGIDLNDFADIDNFSPLDFLKGPQGD